MSDAKRELSGTNICLWLPTRSGDDITPDDNRYTRLKRGYVFPKFTRQSDVKKSGHVVPLFTRQSHVRKRDNVVPMFTRQSDVRKRDDVVPMCTR